MKLYKLGNVTIRETDQKSVVISEKHLVECLQYIEENNIKKIEINELFYKSEHLHFLTDCKKINYIDILSPLLTDISGIYDLENLTGLSYSEGDNINNIELNFAKFPNLEYFYLEWNKKIKGLESIEKLTKLKELHLYNYAPKTKDLTNLKFFEKLKKLTLSNSKVHSLMGIENLKNLKELNIFAVRNLTELANINTLGSTLEKLEIEKCKKITSFHLLGELRSLRELSLIECGEVPSLEFVSALKKLRYFNFYETVIKDGNLTPCLGIDQVNFREEKFYNYNVKDFKSPKDHAEDLKQENLHFASDQNHHSEYQEMEKILKSFQEKINSLNNPAHNDIEECVKKTVLSLNEINKKYDYFIETEEREKIIDFIEENLAEKGIDIDHDIAFKWREW